MCASAGEDVRERDGILINAIGVIGHASWLTSDDADALSHLEEAKIGEMEDGRPGEHAVGRDAQELILFWRRREGTWGVTEEAKERWEKYSERKRDAPNANEEMIASIEARQKRGLLPQNESDDEDRPPCRP